MSYARRHSTNVCPGNRVRYNYRLAFLLAPMLWTAAMLSTGTHYIVRYSFPFIPVGTVLLALALQDLWAFVVASRARATSRPRS